MEEIFIAIMERIAEKMPELSYIDEDYGQLEAGAEEDHYPVTFPLLHGRLVMQRERINRLVHLDVSRQRIVPALYPDQRAGLFRALELLQGFVQLFGLQLPFPYLVIGSGGVVGVIVAVNGQSYGDE